MSQNKSGLKINDELNIKGNKTEIMYCCSKMSSFKSGF